MGEIWRRSATELATAIASGEVSAVEVVQAHLDRIEAVNPSVNAVTLVLADDALQAAKEADRAVAAGESLGALHGVPFTIKENLDVAGSATTQGLPALAGAIAPSDAPVVERLRAIGAIPLARTNLPDMGLRVHTESGLHGVTRNPFDGTKTAGGSSGGEAAALATGMSPLGLGNDIGGSLRNPAYCCGIASLKPTSHRVPSAGATSPQEPFLAAQLMAVDGPMARRVADVRVGFQALIGAHSRDPFCAPVPFEGPALAAPIRVALVPEPPGGATTSTVASAVRAAGDALANAGYDVVESTPPLVEEAIDVWGRWLISEIALLKPQLQGIMSPNALQFLDWAESSIGTVDYAGSFELMMKRHEIARAWSAFFDEHPLIVGPVWTGPAFSAGWDVESEANALGTLELIRFVTPMNLLGLPAAAVPTGIVDGMPTGVQVVGRWFRDDLCLDGAEAIESALGTITPIDPR
ncbi:MAG: amidase [Acidimicrobiaceae bacterium]|jgi:amidase